MHSFCDFPDKGDEHMQLTPRSFEALKRTGYKIDDLLTKASDQINDKYGDNVTDKHLIDKRVAHYD